MLRRLLVASFAVVVIAGCGSGSPTASPSASGSAPASAAPGAATTAPAVTPTEAPSAGANTAGPTTMSAACAAVGLRKLPSSKGALVVRVAAGTSVRVVEVVSGDSYKAGKCGTDGNTWLKIDQVGGKGVKALYGVAFAYAAAGFFN
jgi:hypothetical protein